MGNQINAIMLGSANSARTGNTNSKQLYRAFLSDVSLDESLSIKHEDTNTVQTLLAVCYGEGHPEWTYAKWDAATAQHQPSSYWAWLEQKLGKSARATMRYTGSRNIFRELLSNKKLQLDGQHGVLLHFRADLVGQELVNDVHKKAVIDKKLFQLRPDLLRACKGMDSSFVAEKWQNTLLVEFANEYACGHDPAKTPVLRLVGRNGRETSLTLADLWDAKPMSFGMWEIGKATLSIDL